jgi:hypothetical protein
MITTTIEWHKPTEMLPEKTGYYMCKTECTIQGLHYSAKHNLFNSFDDDTPDKAMYAINPLYWAEIPAELTAESEDE